ncbi:MAG: hypothetical protein IT323_10320 [Anaerolineae bacterium]|nr:hypothetical protein [Anaerolineae bacterium]
MPWTTPVSRAPGDVLSAADHNIYSRDNLLYLHSGRPVVAIERRSGPPYSVNVAAGWVLLDPANLSPAITLTTGRALINFLGCVYSPSQQGVHFDLELDGVRLGGSDGLTRAHADPNGLQAVFTLFRTGLTPGAHTFRLWWRATVDTVYLHADAVMPLCFSVAEW